MEQKQDKYVLNIFVSNQSLALPVTDIELIIDGQPVFWREMTAGTQHNWERVTLQTAGGKHTLIIREANTQTLQSKELDIDRELWISVTFHSPPIRLKVDIFDQPLALM
jgi:hypothetical protein